MNEIFVTVTFPQELRDQWPAEVVAESIVTVDDQSWSVRLDLLKPPDDSGRTVAWMAVLSSKAPTWNFPGTLELTQGRTVVATVELYRPSRPPIKELLKPKTKREWIEDKWEKLTYFLGRTICKIFGHKKPYQQKLTADLCRRCHRVVKHRSPYRVSASIRKED